MLVITEAREEVKETNVEDTESKQFVSVRIRPVLVHELDSMHFGSVSQWSDHVDYSMSLIEQALDDEQPTDR